jgi:ABC-type Fe3+ transport system permease subunit
MQVLGAISLCFFGILLILFALLGFFAHSLVDSAWMHLTGTAAEIAGDQPRMALDAGGKSISMWPSLLTAVIGLMALVSGIVLGFSRRRRRPVRGPVRPTSSLPSCGPISRPGSLKPRSRRRFRF